MSLLGLFEIGKSGLAGNQKALRTTSNNISNVNTPGYTRQSVVMQIASPVKTNAGYMGRGVGDVEIKRYFDNFTFLQILGKSTDYGKSSSMQSGLSNIEQIFNEAKGYGLSSSLEEYFNAWQDLATNPEGAAQRSALLVKAEAFVNTAKQMESDINSTLKLMNDEAVEVVKQINVLSSNIAKLNGKIVEIEAGDIEEAREYRDQREIMMKELASLMDYEFNENSDGSVIIVAARGTIVAGTESTDLSTSINLEGDRDIVYKSNTVTSYISGGELGGLIEARSDIKSNTLHDLRKLVASITHETNMIHYAGYDAAATPNTNVDFFDSLSLYTRTDVSTGTGSIAATIPVATRANVTLDEYDLVFTDASNFELRNHATGAVVVPAGTYTHTAPGPTTFTYNGVEITVTGAPAANDSFFISPLQNAVQNFNVALTDGNQIAASQLATSPPGDNTNVLAMVERFGQDISNLGSVTFQSYYGEIVSKVGSLNQSAVDSLSFDENLLYELSNRRESLSGVSLDEEAANMIRFQRGYEAAARLIKLTDELLETIINL